LFGRGNTLLPKKAFERFVPTIILILKNKNHTISMPEYLSPNSGKNKQKKCAFNNSVVKQQCPLCSSTTPNCTALNHKILEGGTSFLDL
jgi:hypothetical protein